MQLMGLLAVVTVSCPRGMTALFQEISTLQHWSEERAAVILLSKLDGEAFEVASSCPDKTLANLISELRENFATHNHDVIVHELKARVQRKGETFASLASAIRKLVMKAYPTATTETQETLSTEYFIDAILDSKVRSKVRDLKPKTLKEAAGEAREFVAHREVENALNHTSKNPAGARCVTDDDVSPMDGRLTKVEERLGQLHDTLSQQKAAAAPAKEPTGSKGRGRGRGRGPPTCFSCGYKGHIHRWCPFAAGAQFVPPRGVMTQGAAAPTLQPVLQPPPQWQGNAQFNHGGMGN